MKRKGALMPPGTPNNGDFQTIMNNNSIVMHTRTRNNQNRSNHHQINHYRRYFNYFSSVNSNTNVLFFMLHFLLFFISMPLHVKCDEINGGNIGEFVSGYSAGPETYTTTEFDYANRGDKKFGDRCELTTECGFPGSICDHKQKTCQCIPSLPATNQIDKCGKKASINESCFFNEQCEEVIHRTQCREGKCLCFLDLVPVMNKQGILVCETARPEEPKNVQYVDPAMIGILVVMALMFIIICVVLRLFSRARWRENRTIFNTPNPRLMNVSLLRDNKLLHGHERRGSKMSVRGPSRQPSMSSLRPHSPNPSLGSRRGSRGSSNASATSVRSNRSLNGNCQNGGQNEATKPINVHESVTVEITEPKA